jgi:hypothetical protein
MKNLLALVAGLCLSSAAYGQLNPTMPEVTSFYCDECFTEYQRMIDLNLELNGPCCLQNYVPACCELLGAGVRNALDFYRLCGEMCVERPWWDVVLDDRFSFEEFEYLLESYQNEGAL